MVRETFDNAPIAIRDLPEWLERNGFQRVHRNTVTRWVTTGVQGRVLQTRQLGGRRYTSESAIREFTKT